MTRKSQEITTFPVNYKDWSKLHVGKLRIVKFHSQCEITFFLSTLPPPDERFFFPSSVFSMIRISKYLLLLLRSRFFFPSKKKFFFLAVVSTFAAHDLNTSFKRFIFCFSVFCLFLLLPSSPLLCDLIVNAKQNLSVKCSLVISDLVFLAFWRKLFFLLVSFACHIFQGVCGFVTTTSNAATKSCRSHFHIQQTIQGN